MQKSQKETYSETCGETSILIRATPKELYDYLSDLSRHSEWVDNVSKVTQTSPGAVTVGTTYQTQESAPPVGGFARAKMSFFFVAGLISGAKPYSVAEITALKPNKRIAWQAGVRKGEGWFNKANWQLILESQAGGTQVTQRFCYQPQSKLARSMVGAASSEQIAQACAVSLQKLKRVMEANPANAIAT